MCSLTVCSSQILRMALGILLRIATITILSAVHTIFVATTVALSITVILIIGRIVITMPISTTVFMFVIILFLLS